jgi:hypothetical protein
VSRQITICHKYNTPARPGLPRVPRAWTTRRPLLLLGVFSGDCFETASALLHFFAIFSFFLLSPMREKNKKVYGRENANFYKRCARAGSPSLPERSVALADPGLSWSCATDRRSLLSSFPLCSAFAFAFRTEGLQPRSQTPLFLLKPRKTHLLRASHPLYIGEPRGSSRACLEYITLARWVLSLV